MYSSKYFRAFFIICSTKKELENIYSNTNIRYKKMWIWPICVKLSPRKFHFFPIWLLLILRYILSNTSKYVRVHFYLTTKKKIFSKIFTRIQTYFIRKCDFRKKNSYGSCDFRCFTIRVNIFRAVRKTTYSNKKWSTSNS